MNRIFPNCKKCGGHNRPVSSFYEQSYTLVSTKQMDNLLKSENAGNVIDALGVNVIERTNKKTGKAWRCDCE